MHHNFNLLFFKDKNKMPYIWESWEQNASKRNFCLLFVWICFPRFNFLAVEILKRKKKVKYQIKILKFPFHKYRHPTCNVRQMCKALFCIAWFFWFNSLGKYGNFSLLSWVCQGIYKTGDSILRDLLHVRSGIYSLIVTGKVSWKVGSHIDLDSASGLYHSWWLPGVSWNSHSQNFS